MQVIGADDRFWRTGGTHEATPLPLREGLGEGNDNGPPDPHPALPLEGGGVFTGRVVVLNEPLAQELHAAPGDDVLLRIGKPAAVSTETLLGRRDDTTLTLRLTVHAIIPADGLGAFNLDQRQTLSRNAFVPLATLQRALRRPDRVNALLVKTESGDADLATSLLRHVRLEDLELRLRTDTTRGYVALESDAFLLEPAIENAARAAATDTGAQTASILAYLANSIAIEERPDAAIPYSAVAAVAGDGLPDSLTPPIGGIVLNKWAADDLSAAPGDTLRLSYYVSDALGELRTESATFRLHAVVPLEGPANDPGFTPEYAGVTDTDSVADWDPPFPIDLKRIRDKDEDYWDRHRATPKAFVSLTDGQRLWASEHNRFGRLTSLRLYCPSAELASTADRFTQALLTHADPAGLGLTFDPVRERAQDASQGATDFGGLFAGFSFFLIVSAALLVALLFRLGVERRAGEVGLLSALGFSPGRIRGLLLAEGALLAAIGAVGGLFAARGYAWLMLAGLRGWWSAAVNAPFLRLYDSATSYLIGGVVSLIVATISIAWSLRGLTLLPPRALLAGSVQSGSVIKRKRSSIGATITLVLAVVAACVLVALTLTTSAVSQSIAFFLSGTALLIAFLAALTRCLRIEPHRIITTAGLTAAVRLGLRNARRRVGRSILTAGLIASATFLITSLHAMRLEPPNDVTARDSGTGGFSLYAESALPLPYDLNTTAGRSELGLTDADNDALADVTFIPFRLRDGDETSCLNLYRPTRPRLLGAPETMIDRGGFTFSTTSAETDAERRHPWTLLHRTFADGAIPAIADEAAALWQLHVGLGDDVAITDERGRQVPLRLVALLNGSVLQGELVIAESQFKRLFPSIAGPAFYLIEAPADRAAAIEATLEKDLTDFGLAVRSTRQRLAELHVIQNTYLSTYQTLGGLGLLLGTLGLAAVLLRNVWERRSELALLRALGFSRSALGVMVLSENLALVAAGLAAGLVSAVVVAAPRVATNLDALPWASLLLMLAAVLAGGMLVGLAALIPALRAPLLPTLRSE